MSKQITQIFSAHPASVGESYFEHLISAVGFSLRMILGGCACLVHALLPFLFVTTGKETVLKLNDMMVVNRDKRPKADEQFHSVASKVSSGK